MTLTHITATTATTTAAGQQVPGVVLAEQDAGRLLIRDSAVVVLTGHGHVFTAELADPATLPIRVRCQLCPWQATTPLHHAAATADVHALAHVTALAQLGSQQ